jgi:predicted kinase
MATLYIIRGVSGSGKTTYAKELAAKVKCAHLETDMYFTFRDGDECEYRFNPSLLPKAHEWCFNEVAAVLNMGHDVIVSNTFTRLWEFRNYIDLAIDKGAKIRVITCRGRYQNTHGLTEAMVAKQVARFQSNLEVARELMHNAARYGCIVFSNNG